MDFYGTLGASCRDEETLYQMFRAGMTGARLNLSHTDLEAGAPMLNSLHAAARRAASLEAKGYLIRQANPKDGRSQLLFATEKAEGLRNSKAQVETTFYEWLLAELPEAEKVAFCKTLDTIYRRSKQESRAGFPHITALTEQGEGARHE